MYKQIREEEIINLLRALLAAGTALIAYRFVVATYPSDDLIILILCIH